MSVEYGVVKEYSRDAKRGVLVVLVNRRRTREELPFFMADGRLVELKDGNPQFIRKRIVEPGGRGRPSRVQRGDHVVVRVGNQLAFERSEHDKALIKHWSRAHDYKECLRELGGPYYRVIRRDEAKPWNFEVICENLTRAKLKTQYPIEPNDPLDGCEFQFWNFDHTRPTRGGSYYSCSPGWDECWWGDPRTHGS